ncbi:MAG TPA: Gfo/Idh/MocA family oxidoreductase [Rugosimonospora sp.]|nr:Gfo/Idh/MocA family oxidoreductase [Rugosimonospora sp.]
MALRFGVLGTGYWAAEIHAAGLAGHPGAALAGVWGRDAGKAEVLARRFGVPAYTDVDALIADVDAVAVALPPDVQAPLAARAARAGRHLLLDKPLALTVAAADEVVRAVAGRDVASVIFFTRRFSPAIDTFLREASGTPGWSGARVTLFASIFQPGNPFGASPWRRERGGLWDVGPHALSLLLPVLGPVAGAYGTEGPHQTAYATLRHTGGAVSTLELTLDAPAAAVTHGTLLYGEPGLRRVPDEDLDAPGAFGRAVDQLLAAAAAGPGERGHPCDVRFGREVVAILTAIEASITSGATEPV